MNNKKFKQIIEKVPVDYYDKTNFLQKIWHHLKLLSFKKIIRGQKFTKVLDIGCAGGTFTNNISQLLPNSQIFAIDAYSDSIRYAQKKYKHIKFLSADAHKLPFNNNSFDLIISYETIEHVINPQKVLKEMRRILKKNGKVILAMDSGSLLFQVIWFFWENTKGKIWQGAHLHPFHYSELTSEIEKSGFNIRRRSFSHFNMEVTFLLEK